MDDFEQTFNPEEYLYFYGAYFTPEKLNKEVNFLTKHAQLDRPLEILDLACGHGRHANALAQLGHRMTGIDITEGFLKIAKEDAAKLNVSVNYLHQDMRELNYDNAFDRIFALFTAIGYFDEEQNEKVFRNIYKALKPNGIFCFDSHNRDTFLTYCQPASVIEKENNFMIDQNCFDTLTGRSETKRTVIYNQSIRSFRYSVRFYNPTEIIKLFKQIGFSAVEFYDNWETKPLGQGSKRMVVVARK